MVRNEHALVFKGDRRPKGKSNLMPVGYVMNDEYLEDVIARMANALWGDDSPARMRRLWAWFEKMYEVVKDIHEDRDEKWYQWGICHLCGEFGEVSVKLNKSGYRQEETCVPCGDIISTEKLRMQWIEELLKCEICESIVEYRKELRVCKACQAERKATLAENLLRDEQEKAARQRVANDRYELALMTIKAEGRIAAEAYDEQEVLRAEGGFCHLCHHHVNETHRGTPDGWEIEHIMPRALGGPDIRSNVRVAHYVCNRKKSAYLLGEISSRIPFDPPPSTALKPPACRCDAHRQEAYDGDQFAPS